MQSIWRGAISFGLVTIPVRLFSATEEKTLRFNLLHRTDDGRVRNNRTCTVCGQDNLTKDDLVRAYEYEKGNYVKFDEDELDRVQVETSHNVDVLQFTPAIQIDPIYYQRSYYLAPEELGVKAYALLRRALESSDSVAIAKVAIRDKERLATLRTRDGVIVLETMYWPDEIRAADFPALERLEEPREQELKMAEQLVENLTEDFDPSQFRDTYREALLQAVEAKVAGREITAPPERAAEAPVVDLSEALERSLEQVRSRRAEGGSRAAGE
jgi:DNA end-binding protein Ku